MPYILSINTNINDYAELIIQPSINHFVAYFENYNERYPNSIKKWYKFDDLYPKYKEVKNIEFSLNNIRNGEGVALLIYIRK